MKKKFISVAMFCALIASSPVWVGCSDYDDDIANLQSQVDALKQTVDVSTAEALKALQEAQAALQEDINELTAGKADAQAVKDLQETVAALQTAITENDITKIGELSSQVSELIAQVNGIEGDLDKTQSDLQQQKTELEGKVNSLRADLEKAIADKADQATVDSIKSELDTAVTNLTDVENRLVEVEKWIKNNGQELAKLTANVSQINNLIAKISEEAATTISDPAILAAIKALPTTVSSLTTLQQQIGKETEAGSILYRLAALEEWKNTIVTELLTGTGYSSFADICQDIKELQEALTGSGSETPGVDPSDPGLVEQFNALKAEMAKFDMIQSVVYIPNATEAETGYLLKSSVLKVYNKNSTAANEDDKYEEVAQSTKSNTIQFRVSPASKAKDFTGDNPKYTLTFDGTKIEKKNFSELVTVGEARLKDADAGIIEYTVETQIKDNEVWAVCAVIKAVEQTAEEGEESTGAKDNTELTTTYFTATRVTDKVKTIAVTNSNQDKTTMPYKNPDGSESTIDYTAGRKVVGYDTSNTPIVEDMIDEYGVPTTITYKCTADNTEWFEVENGVLSMTDASNAMIGRTVTVTASVTLGSIELQAPAYKEVTVTRRVVEHTVAGEPKTLIWNQNNQYIALSTGEMDAIIKETELSRGDFNELVEENKPTNLNSLCLMTGADILTLDTEAENVENDNTLYIVVPGKLNTGTAQTLDITLKEETTEGTSTTQTDSYVIKVKVSDMQYPVSAIEKNPVRWNQDGQTIEYTPQIEWEKGTTDIVASMNNVFNAKDLFADYEELNKQANDLGFKLVVGIKDNATIKGVTYNNANRTLTYDKSQYEGDNVSLVIYLDYNGKKIAETYCEISVQKLSGTWKNPTEMAMTVYDLSKTYNVSTGAEWVDFAGRTIWKDGAVVETTKDDKGNWKSKFSKDPFSTMVYGMTAPSFAIVNPHTGKVDDYKDKYVIVDSKTGVVTFDEDATQSGFDAAHTVTIRISADSPWGAIENMNVGESGYYVDVTFTIGKGASNNYKGEM